MIKKGDSDKSNKIAERNAAYGLLFMTISSICFGIYANSVSFGVGFWCLGITVDCTLVSLLAAALSVYEENHEPKE